MTRHRPWLAPLAFAVLLAAALAGVYGTAIGDRLTNWRALAGWVADDSLQSQATFLLLSSLLIVFGVPRLVFFTLGGFAFGFWTGLGWSVCSILIGSFAAFRLARTCGRSWLRERFAAHRHFGRIVNAAPSVPAIALLRLLPISNAVVNVGLAVGRVDDRTFLLGSLLGFLPHGILAVLIGSGLAEASAWEGLLQLGAAAVLLSVAAWAAGKRLRRH